MTDLFGFAAQPKPAPAKTASNPGEKIDMAAWAQADKIGRGGFPRGGWEELNPEARRYYQSCYYWAIIDGIIKREG